MKANYPAAEARRYRRLPENSTDALSLGFDAFGKGKTLDDNPYEKPGRGRVEPLRKQFLRQWRAGWQDAAQDVADAEYRRKFRVRGERTFGV